MPNEIERIKRIKDFLGEEWKAAKEKEKATSEEEKAAKTELETAKIQKRTAEEGLDRRLKQAEAEKRWHEGAWENVQGAHTAVQTSHIGIRLTIALVLDVLDFFVGKMPVIGSVIGDLILSIFGVILWGPVGLVQAWEALEPTDLIDGFVPTLFLIGLYKWWKEKGANDQRPSKQQIYLKEKSHFWRKALLWIILLLLFGSLVPGAMTLVQQYVDPDSPLGKVVLWPGKVALMATNMVTNAWQSFTRFTERSIALATGDYYTGRVDANAKEKLGVYLEDLKPASREFYQDEPVTIWGTLYAKTLDPDKPLQVRLGCYLDDDARKVGRMDPGYLPEIMVEERADLQCTFPRGTVNMGSSEATFVARFNFSTEAYTKAYFMGQERLRSFQRDETNPLNFYQVQDQHPIAIYTNGPVLIGMDTLQPLIGVREDGDTKFRLGITVENLWQGKIKELKELMLKIPESMNLVDCDPQKQFVEVPCQGERECEVDEQGNERYTRVYKLATEENLHEKNLLCMQECERSAPLRENNVCFDECMARARSRSKFGDITTFETFHCRVQIPRENRMAVLGDTPSPETHYFKAIAVYDYELFEEVPVTVKRSVGFNVYFAGDATVEGIEQGKLKCIGIHTDMEVPSVSYGFYKLEGAQRVPLLLEESRRTVCKDAKKCEVTVRRIAPVELQRGDRVECVMTNKFEDTDQLHNSFKGTLNYECGLQCNQEVPWGEAAAYNSCMEACKVGMRKKLASELYSGSHMVTIENSRPSLLAHAPKYGPTTVVIDVELYDWDVKDQLRLGLDFEGYRGTATEIPVTTCDTETRNGKTQQVCETHVELTNENAERDRFVVTLTPSDGQLAGSPKKVTVQLKGGEP